MIGIKPKDAHAHPPPPPCQIGLNIFHFIDDMPYPTEYPPPYFKKFTQGEFVSFR